MVSATTIATANPKKIIENRNKDMDIEKGNEETHTHKDCFGENTNTIKMIMIPIFYVFMICVLLFLLYMLKIVVCECE
jgi:hypothetical protein